MKVHYDEGVANHVGPEPCAGIREDVGEASVGEHAGQPLSREKDLISDADAVLIAEGNMGGALCECLTNPAREPGDLRVGHGLFGGHGPQREGEEP
ncbi:hypothetical protein [Sinorhizobium sp. GL28]|uniref:hypothetical protein n=1 Tax=Sinorhizobium sp. GL28 TaxID=1358418 RepID=UPI000B0E5975|nr:hypothetical protein [Sinorhizobium sp. GL28]